MIEKLKAIVSRSLESHTQLSEEHIFEMLESPKSIDHGHLSFPVFSLSKTLKKAPQTIAQDLAGKITDSNFVVESVGGYLNFKFKSQFIQDTLQNSLKENKRLGFKEKNNQRVVIDYSSPNVAKPMSIGHLRATVIGQAVRNLAQSQGYEVTGLNYLGDWGVQFGKLAYAYMEWRKSSSKKYDFENNSFEALFELYVDFHKASEENPDLEKKGSLVFKKLEEGDPEIEKIWKMFLDISLKEYDRIYKILNVKFDLIQGESFYNDKMESVVNLLKEKKLLEDSDGAQVVFLNEKMPPCIIKKSDGASLYATRDITSAIHRHDILKGDHLLYVVGVDQTLHFQQVFMVLEKMGFNWAKNCHHVSFGMYRFKDMGKMSTRRGNVIFMDDVLRKSVDLAKKIIEEKNPDLEDKESVAQKVGVGAIVFNDLISDRVKNVDFDWDQVLNFEGDSGPYIQYCIVRCKSILRKYGKEIPKNFSSELNEREERELLKQLMSYSETLSFSYRSFRPNVLAQYLLDLCKAFNSFYQKHKILDNQLDPSMVHSRLYLVFAVEKVLTEGLSILGVPVPEKM